MCKMNNICPKSGQELKSWDKRLVELGTLDMKYIF